MVIVMLSQQWMFKNIKHKNPVKKIIYKKENKYFIPCWFSEFATLQKSKRSIIFSVGPSRKWETEY